MMKTRKGGDSAQDAEDTEAYLEGELLGVDCIRHDREGYHE
jgi:hypothetical protein